MIPKARILIVDDDPALLEQAELILDPFYQVSVAISGVQALTYLKREPSVDLILLDILMPQMDGFDTMTAIRRIPGQQDTPIIFLTSLSDTESELHGLTAGAADYISKPFDSRILLARVQRCMTVGSQLDEEKLSNLETPLTDAEWKVAKLLARSYSNDEISQEMHYALDTVKKIVSRILDKLQIKSRKEIKKYIRK